MRRIEIYDIFGMVMGTILFCVCLFYLADGRTGLIAFVCCIICFLPTVLKVAGILTLPAPLVVLIILAAFLHGFGVVTSIYTKVGNYDTVTHTLSSMTVAILIFYAMMCFQYYGGGRVNFTGKGLALFTALLSLTFSVYWEVFEYLSDVLIGSVTQYSPYDTMTDLVCDTLGTVLASVWVGFYMRKRTIADVVRSFGLDARARAFAARGRQ